MEIMIDNNYVSQKGETMKTTKKFSPEFQHDIADLLEYCYKNKTDSLTITMNYRELDLDIDMTFSIHPHEEGADDD